MPKNGNEVASFIPSLEQKKEIISFLWKKREELFFYAD